MGSDFSASIGKEYRELLQVLAHNEDRSMSSVVRQALKEYSEKRGFENGNEHEQKKSISENNNR